MRKKIICTRENDSKIFWRTELFDTLPDSAFEWDK